MKILIVGTVKNPQFKRLEQEGEKKGHQVEGCYSYDLMIKARPDSFKATLKDKKLESYDLVYLWSFAKRRWEWVMAASWLAQKYKTKIVNQKIIASDYLYALTPAAEYLKQTKAKIRYPRSTLVFSANYSENVAKDFDFPLIVKISASRQGKGVFKIKSPEELKVFFQKQKKETNALIIREFIPNDGDIRVFTVGYRAIGAMKRTPKKGDFRSNISQGGQGSKFNLKKHPEVRKIAEKLSRLTRTEIAGVDIMLHAETKKPYVLEINPGPQFTGLEKYTKTNAALAIINYFERVLTSEKQGSA